MNKELLRNLREVFSSRDSVDGPDAAGVETLPVPEEPEVFREGIGAETADRLRISHEKRIVYDYSHLVPPYRAGLRETDRVRERIREALRQAVAEKESAEESILAFADLLILCGLGVSFDPARPVLDTAEAVELAEKYYKRITLWRRAVDEGTPEDERIRLSKEVYASENRILAILKNLRKRYQEAAERELDGFARALEARQFPPAGYGPEGVAEDPGETGEHSRDAAPDGASGAVPEDEPMGAPGSPGEALPETASQAATEAPQEAEAEAPRGTAAGLTTGDGDRDRGGMPEIDGEAPPGGAPAIRAEGPAEAGGAPPPLAAHAEGEPDPAGPADAAGPIDAAGSVEPHSDVAAIHEERRRLIAGLRADHAIEEAYIAYKEKVLQEKAAEKPPEPRERKTKDSSLETMLQLVQAMGLLAGGGPRQTLEAAPAEGGADKAEKKTIVRKLKADGDYGVKDKDRLVQIIYEAEGRGLKFEKDFETLEAMVYRKPQSVALILGQKVDDPVFYK